jgi:hypothetical protein
LGGLLKAQCYVSLSDSGCGRSSARLCPSISPSGFYLALRSTPWFHLNAIGAPCCCKVSAPTGSAWARRHQHHSGARLLPHRQHHNQGDHPGFPLFGSCWRHATIAEIAAAEKINESCVRRVLRLTLIASDIVDASLSGRQQAVAVLMRPFAVALTEDINRLLTTFGGSP